MATKPAKQALSKKILVTNRGGTAGQVRHRRRQGHRAGGEGAGRGRRQARAQDHARLPRRRSARAKRVTDATDPAENKAAVDAVAKKHRPEYLVILGSHDVVPYQDLKNKLHDPADPDSDPDRFAGSDLPYACEAPTARTSTKFLGPTRVVGRVPDLTGAATPTYLLALLKASASGQAAPRPDSCFALSAKVWVKSTKMSVRNILGRGAGRAHLADGRPDLRQEAARRARCTS